MLTDALEIIPITEPSSTTGSASMSYLAIRSPASAIDWDAETVFTGNDIISLAHFLILTLSLRTFINLSFASTIGIFFMDAEAAS